MFIPPQKMQGDLRSQAAKEAKVQLKSAHLLIDHTLAMALFHNSPNVNMIYYPDRQTLMIAPESDELFKQLHKAKPHMLKDKNAQGDKTIAIHELLIDHEINDSDRELAYREQKELNILNVTI
ncbi:MAG: hypothetical protein KTR30_34350 [Saprospiraceae bacterium]|nr:hypothetical protein [Saprospiraceae bacterium]